MVNLEFDINRIFKEAKERLKVRRDEDLEWYSWPQVFPSTAGPKPGGIGGQALTTFQVFAFISRETGERIKGCNGYWTTWNGEFLDRWRA